MPVYKDGNNGTFYVQCYYRDARGSKRHNVSVNIIFTIFTNVFSPIAPTRMRRIRQRGCAAFGA